VALHAIAEMQKTGEKACLIDAEHAFDRKYAAVGAAPCGARWGGGEGCQGTGWLGSFCASSGVGLISVESCRLLAGPGLVESPTATPPRPQKMGVNVDDILLSQPDSGEQALDVADNLGRRCVSAAPPRVRRLDAIITCPHTQPAGPAMAMECEGLESLAYRHAS